MNNNYTKFEFKEMKTFGVTDEKTMYPISVADELTDGWTDCCPDGRTTDILRPQCELERDPLSKDISN